MLTYKIVQIKKEKVKRPSCIEIADLEKEINAHASEGWELDKILSDDALCKNVCNDIQSVLIVFKKQM